MEQCRAWKRHSDQPPPSMKRFNADCSVRLHVDPLCRERLTRSVELSVIGRASLSLIDGAEEPQAGIETRDSRLGSARPYPLEATSRRGMARRRSSVVAQRLASPMAIRFSESAQYQTLSLAIRSGPPVVIGAGSSPSRTSRPPTIQADMMAMKAVSRENRLGHRLRKEW